jgi:hypothetical protein
VLRVPPHTHGHVALDTVEHFDDAEVVAMAAPREVDAERLVGAESVDVTSRTRQVAMAPAHPTGDGELVDALAWDHVVTHPAGLIVSWTAPDAGTH